MPVRLPPMTLICSSNACPGRPARRPGSGSYRPASSAPGRRCRIGRDRAHEPPEQEVRPGPDPSGPAFWNAYTHTHPATTSSSGCHLPTVTGHSPHSALPPAGPAPPPAHLDEMVRPPVHGCRLLSHSGNGSGGLRHRPGWPGQPPGSPLPTELPFPGQPGPPTPGLGSTPCCSVSFR